MPRIKVMTSVIAVVIFLQIIFLVHLHQRPSVNLPTKGEPKKVHLLILSTWRSGSSLLGQFFSQHPDVFYLMEPAWHVWQSLPHYSAHVLHMSVRDMVRSVFKCDMSVFDTYMKSEKNISALFQWYSSKALCAPPACHSFSRYNITNETACKKLCGNDSFSKIEETCDKYTHIVVKEVRFFDITVLYPLLKDPSLNLKILHLVRDPRAVGKSRGRAPRALAGDNGIVLDTNGTKINDTNYEVLRKICESHVNMYKIASYKPPPFLKGKYMLVRYEDLVRNPLKKVEELYKFANLQLTDQLAQWIYNITHGEGPAKRKEAFETTTRNALNVSVAWRGVLPFEKVRQIQDVCKEAFTTLKYQFMNSEAEQQDMSRDFILPMK
ncbi:carbohydrate sulfotransferase 6-like [Bufo bufo]|uniref:carbohydrate sulfotransferase 6-like n=1 Tax=Bufo bufo TaxID=8384 RepID=UPI001ABEA0CC|nr:carbohydrate sulfotransferase 6-like [Bufo bufo]